MLTRSIDDLVKEETTDREAKSILFGEYETKVYPIYREELNKFGDTQSANYGTWWTLGPSADTLFLTFNPYYNTLTMHSPTLTR